MPLLALLCFGSWGLGSLPTLSVSLDGRPGWTPPAGAAARHLLRFLHCGRTVQAPCSSDCEPPLYWLLRSAPRADATRVLCFDCSPCSAHTAMAYSLVAPPTGATRAASAAQAGKPGASRAPGPTVAQCSTCWPQLAWYLLPAPCSRTLTYIGRRSGSTWGSRMFLAAADGHYQARGQPVLAF